MGSHPHCVALGDLDGDGYPDIATANVGSPDGVSVLLSRGNGAFEPRVEYEAGSGPLSIAIGDLDGDGHADLAVLNQSSVGESVLHNRGDGTFVEDAQYRTGFYPTSVRSRS